MGPGKSKTGSKTQGKYQNYKKILAGGGQANIFSALGVQGPLQVGLCKRQSRLPENFW